MAARRVLPPVTAEKGRTMAWRRRAWRGACTAARGHGTGKILLLLDGRQGLRRGRVAQGVRHRARPGGGRPAAAGAHGVSRGGGTVPPGGGGTACSMEAAMKGHYFALTRSFQVRECSARGTPWPTGRRKPAACCIWPIYGSDRVYRYALQTASLPHGGVETLCLPRQRPRQPLCPPQGGFAVVCELDGMSRFFREDGALSYVGLPASGMPGPNAPGAPAGWAQHALCGNRGPTRCPLFRLTPSGQPCRGMAGG